MNQKTIAIDFDGTIAHYDGFKGKGIFGDPTPGIKSVLEKFKILKFNIIIYTTRSETAYVREYLTKHKIPYE